MTRYEATGYGRTEHEARADALSKIEDQRSMDSAAEMTGGILHLGIFIGLGYLKLAFELVLAMVRFPFGAFALSLGIVCGYGFLWWLLPVDHDLHSFGDYAGAFFTYLIVLSAGSGLSAGLSSMIVSAAAQIDRLEQNILLRLGFFAWPLVAILTFAPTLAGFLLCGLFGLRFDYVLWSLFSGGIVDVAIAVLFVLLQASMIVTRIIRLRGDSLPEGV